MQGVRDRIRGLHAVMATNVMEFARRTGRTPGRIDAETGLSDNLLRWITAPETAKPPTLKTLSRLEAFYEGHEAWPGNGSGTWRDTGTKNGNILQLIYDDYKIEHFEEVIAVWDAAREGRADIDAFKKFDNVSIINATPTLPEDFLLVHHAGQSERLRGGASDQGLRLGDRDKPDYYQQSFHTDLLWVKLRDEPTLSEAIWSAAGDTRVAYYYRLILPLKPFLLSALHISRMNDTLENEVSTIIRQPAA